MEGDRRLLNTHKSRTQPTVVSGPSVSLVSGRGGKPSLLGVLCTQSDHFPLSTASRSLAPANSEMLGQKAGLGAVAQWMGHPISTLLCDLWLTANLDCILSVSVSRFQSGKQRYRVHD